MIINPHGGEFHADDVMASAMLGIVHPEATIIRGECNAESKIMVDHGGGAYDHHDGAAVYRPNGIPYASAGLVWRDYGETIVRHFSSLNDLLIPRNGIKDITALVDDILIEHIDQFDNGIDDGSMPLARALECLNPTRVEDADTDERFAIAMNMAISILTSVIARAITEWQVASKVAPGDATVVVLPSTLAQDVPLAEIAARWPAAQFVVYFGSWQTWNAEAIRIRPDRFAIRCPFPAEWGSLAHRDLFEMGLTFVHRNRFFVAARTKSAAIAACRKALSAAGLEYILFEQEDL